FTATSDAWAMDGAPDGSVYLGLADRPAALVRLSLGGTSTEVSARHPAFAQLDMILVLPDGRTVFPSATFGHTRLMALEKGRDPVALANTPEETAAPMTVVGPRAIGFMIGPVPHQTIAVADVGSGRVERRIAPGKGRID